MSRQGRNNKAIHFASVSCSMPGRAHGFPKEPFGNDIIKSFSADKTRKPGYRTRRKEKESRMVNFYAPDWKMDALLQKCSDILCEGSFPRKDAKQMKESQQILVVDLMILTLRNFQRGLGILLPKLAIFLRKSLNFIRFFLLYCLNVYQVKSWKVKRHSIYPGAVGMGCAFIAFWRDHAESRFEK